MKSSCDDNIQNKRNAISIGIALMVSTFTLIFMMSYLPKGGSRTVASFVAGMFGFTAIQALRRGFDE